MKNVLSKTKIAIIILAVTVLFLGFYIYMIARPISYGMTYSNKTVYEGETFEGTLKYRTDGKVISENSNFDEEMTYYYYYRDGYVFNLLATNDAQYEAEVAIINANFETVISTPFGASKTNAFKQVAVGMDENVTAYTCTGAIIFAIVGGVFALALIALSAFSCLLTVKAKNNENEENAENVDNAENAENTIED